MSEQTHSSLRSGRRATFGSGGIVVTNLGVDPFGNAIQGNVSAAALQSDGDIVVAVVNTATGDSGLLRYLPDGTRDTMFGHGGFAAFIWLGAPP